MKKKCLIIGSTGRTGTHLVNNLVDTHELSIVVRDSTKAKSIFKNIYDRINVIECELGMNKINSDLKKAVANSDILISSIGSNFYSDSKITDYDSIVELINICEEQNPNIKFIFITSMFITRPYTTVAFVLNNIISYVLGWKALAENRLRQSKLNYSIIRPGGLKDETNEKSVKVFQGDKNNGHINRSNLAKFILYAINDSNLNQNRVTYEVIEDKNSSNFDVITDKLKRDDESSFIIADHFRATRNMNICVSFIIFIIMILLIWNYK